MVTLIMMMVMLAKWKRGVAECSISVWAHPICSPVPASEWERKLVNSRTKGCSFRFSCSPSPHFFSFRDLRADTMCRGLCWGLYGPQTIHLYTVLLVGDMKVPSLAAPIDSYFLQGIKSYCKIRPILPFRY